MPVVLKGAMAATVGGWPEYPGRVVPVHSTHAMRVTCKPDKKTTLTGDINK
jgi:hypothetical protein